MARKTSKMYLRISETISLSFASVSRILSSDCSSSHFSIPSGTKSGQVSLINTLFLLPFLHTLWYEIRAGLLDQLAQAVVILDWPARAKGNFECSLYLSGFVRF